MRDACAKFPNLVKFIVAKTTENEHNYSLKIGEWLNTTVADSTGFTPVELLFEAKKPDLFEKILTKLPENLPEPETIGDKVMKAYARMRKKAKGRRKRRKTGNKTWERKVNEKVLVRAQPASDAAKFIHPCEGPYIRSRGDTTIHICDINHQWES